MKGSQEEKKKKGFVSSDPHCSLRKRRCGWCCLRRTTQKNHKMYSWSRWEAPALSRWQQGTEREQRTLKHNPLSEAPVQRMHASSAPGMDLTGKTELMEPLAILPKRASKSILRWSFVWHGLPTTGNLRGKGERATRKICVFVTLWEWQPEALSMGWRVFPGKFTKVLVR